MTVFRGGVFSLKSSIFCLLLMFGFATAVRAETETSVPLIDVVAEIDSYRALLEESDPETIGARLQSLYSDLLNLSIRDLSKKDVLSHTNIIIQKAVSFRSALVQKIPGWQATGHWSKESEKTVRNILRAIRYFEDNVAELSFNIGHSALKPFDLPVFKGGTPFVVSPTGETFIAERDLKPGDLILTRGESDVSAAIARVTEVQTQFSHLLMITRDPQTQKLVIAESLIETGLKLTPINDFLHHRVGRAVVFRAKDEQAGIRASEFIWNFIKTSPHVEYDFGMDMQDHTRLFCSEVIKFAFESANPGFQMPYFPSDFNSDARPFLSRIGVSEKNTTTFAPGDIELDPRFQVVAEFRDFSKTPTHRVSDMIFDKVFEWLGEGGAFEKNRMINIVSHIAHAAVQIEFFNKIAMKLKLPISPYVKPVVIQTVAGIFIVRSAIMKELQPKIDSYFDKYGVVPPPKTIKDWLDEMRNKATNRAFKALKLKPKPERSCETVL